VVQDRVRQAAHGLLGGQLGRGPPFGQLDEPSQPEQPPAASWASVMPSV
jgi:hypothetical protein